MRPALVPILLADPMPWAFKAPYAWDFLRDRARFAGGYRGALANTPNWTFTRASTAYYTNSAGVLTSVASGVLRTGDRGALIEGARTNLLTKSQELDHVNWTKTNCTVSADAVAAPDGTLTADTVSASSTGNTGQAQGFTGTAAAYTWSVYVKAGTSTFLRLVTNDGTNTYQSWFNLTTGATATVAAQHTATIFALSGGWYRCSVTATMAVASCTAYTRLADADNSTTATSGTTMSFWGAQVELGAFPSSYIPTTTASATRAADVLTVPVTMASPLTGFLEFAYADGVTSASASASQYGLVLGSTDNSNRLILYNPSSANGQIVQVAAATQSQIGVAGLVLSGVTQKVASRVATNDFQFASNGTLGTPDVSGTALSDIVTARFGGIAGTNATFGYLRRAALWTRALTDAELQSLTT